MPSISVTARIVNGGQWSPFSGEASSAEVVDLICGEGLAPPPTGVTIELTTSSGRRVEVHFPRSEGSAATVRIDGERV